MVHEEVAVFVDLSRGIHVSQDLWTYADVAPARTVECEQQSRVSRSHRFSAPGCLRAERGSVV